MSERRGPGAPLKLTDDVRAKIIAHLVAGCTLEIAATAAGVQTHQTSEYPENAHVASSLLEFQPSKSRNPRRRAAFAPSSIAQRLGEPQGSPRRRGRQRTMAAGTVQARPEERWPPPAEG